MKKLMIALVAVAMAAGAQAYSVSWGLSNMDGATFTDWDGNTIDGTGSTVTGYLLALTGADTGATFKDGALSLGTAQVVHNTGWTDDLGGWGNAADVAVDSTVSNLGNKEQYFQIVLVEGGVQDITKLAEGTHVYVLTPEMVEGVDPTPGGTNWSYDQLDMSTSLVKDSWGKTGGTSSSHL